MQKVVQTDVPFRRLRTPDSGAPRARTRRGFRISIWGGGLLVAVGETKVAELVGGLGLSLWGYLAPRCILSILKARRGIHPSATMYHEQQHSECLRKLITMRSKYQNMFDGVIFLIPLARTQERGYSEFGSQSKAHSVEHLSRNLVPFAMSIHM